MNRLIGLTVATMALVTMTACQTRLDAPFIDKGSFVSVQPTTSFDLIVWRPDIPASQRTVDIHSADGGPSAGSVILDLDGGSTAQRLGVSLMAGNSSLRFVAGVDCRFNNITSEIDDDDDDEDWDYGEGPMRDIERQPLPGSFDSYGYAWIEPSDYTWIPYLGVEAEIADLVILGLEAGTPYGKFTYERGHFRNFIATPIENDSWRGFGKRASGRMGLRVLDNRGMVGLQYAFERYDTSFANLSSEIDAHVFSLFFSLRF
jgi:hypothetical protein